MSDLHDLLAAETVSVSLPGVVSTLLLHPKHPLRLPPALPVLLFPDHGFTARGILASPFLLSADSFNDLALSFIANAPLVVTKDDLVAKLILLPAASDLMTIEQAVLPEWPTLTVSIRGRPFTGLIDTGADVSVIRSDLWPQDWPLHPAPSVRGVGGVQTAQISSDWLSATAAGSSASVHIKPFILPLHTNLWGRDLLSQMNATLTLR